MVRGEGVRVAGRSNINVTYGEYPLSRLEFRRSDPLCSSLRTASASLQTKPSLNWRAFSVLVPRAQARVKKVRSVLRAHLVRLLETSHQSVRTLSRTNTSLAEELPARTDSAALPAAPLGTIANPVRSTVVYRKIRRHLRVSVHHGA